MSYRYIYGLNGFHKGTFIKCKHRVYIMDLGSRKSSLEYDLAVRVRLEFKKMNNKYSKEWKEYV